MTLLERDRAWKHLSHIHAPSVGVEFVSRVTVCLSLPRQVLLCRFPSGGRLFILKSVLIQIINYAIALALLLVLHLYHTSQASRQYPNHRPHFWTPSLLGDDPMFYFTEILSSTTLSFPSFSKEEVSWCLSRVNLHLCALFSTCPLILPHLPSPEPCSPHRSFFFF